MQELIKKFYKGAAINTTNSLFIYSINFIISLILMRYIGPTEFGYMAIINIFISLFFLVSELGLNSVIIQKEELTDIELNSILIFRFVLSLVLILLFYIASFYIEGYYKIANLQHYMVLCSFVLFSSSLNAVAISVSKRRMEFGKLARSQSIAIISAGIISVIFAMRGFGIYSLILKQVLPTVFMFYLFYQLRLKINFEFDWQAFRALLKRSKYFSFSQVLNIVSNKTNSFLISTYLGPVDLGVFDKSHSTMLIPVNQVKSKTLIALFPALSKLNAQKQEIGSVVLHVSRILASISFPLVLGIYFLVDEFVVLYLSDEWLEMIKYVKLFCIIALVKLPTFPGYIFMVKNEMRKKVKIDWLVKPLSIIMSLIGIYYMGLMGIVIAFFIGAVIQFIVNNYYSSKLINLKFSQILMNLKWHYIVTLLAIAVYEGMMYVYTKTGTVSYASLLLKSILLIFVVSLFYMFFIRKEMKYIQSLRSSE